MDFQSLFDLIGLESAEAKEGKTLFPSTLANQNKTKAAKKVIPAAPVVEGPVPTPAPTPLNPALQNAALSAAEAQNTIKKNTHLGVGDKLGVSSSDKNEKTEGRNIALNESYLKEIGAIRDTPEWQRQEKGLDELEQLIALDAEKNAKKTSIDLSPLGAYEDMVNKRYGGTSNFSSAWKGTPVESTSIKDMGEVQRRRGDMAKELIDTIKASKVGQIVTKDGVVVGITSGFDAPNPNTSMARLDQSAWKAAIAEKHKQFDKSDTAMAALNTVARELESNIPSDINRLKIQRAMADMNGLRPALAEVMMESGNLSLVNKFNQAWAKIKDGRVHSKRDLDEFWESARETYQAIKVERNKRAAQYRETVSGLGIGEDRVGKLISQDYIDSGFTNKLSGMPEKRPEKAKTKETAKNPKFSDEQLKALLGK